MKTNKLTINGKFQAHQGDIQMFSIDGIPSDAKRIEKTFIAKSDIIWKQ